MDEAGDDLLAGPRLTKQQHRRVGPGDARGCVQHLPPGHRLADDAAMSGALVEFAEELLHAVLEQSSALGRLIGPS